MKPEKLTDIKKELLNLNVQHLTDICLRLARYKKENKEFLNYLLFDSTNVNNYVNAIKGHLEDEFKNLHNNYYYSTKALRKTLRTLNRHIKYTASKEAELELLLWFCKNFLLYADTRSTHKPLLALFVRQVEKVSKIIPKLHEDLQYDYRQELEDVLREAQLKMRGFSFNNLNL